MKKAKTYFLCSSQVVLDMKPEEISRPIIWHGNDKMYIAVLNFEECDKHYNKKYKGKVCEHVFFLREITQGTMDTSKLTMYRLQKENIFDAIEMYLDLSTERNVAMCIGNVSYTYGITPIELFNKIRKSK